MQTRQKTRQFPARCVGVVRRRHRPSHLHTPTLKETSKRCRWRTLCKELRSLSLIRIYLHRRYKSYNIIVSTSTAMATRSLLVVDTYQH
ncbi:hypothetical protein FD723_29165 [Nostoc sp. C052]|uniref:hypothetical protein n=1 Tax=unclassified Nostoc TaxID=2593658 RepID=UPI0015C3C221|nr:hypothetical protein [Nostoc sp. C052]QLE44113.1 hypothetical protein FD723_29165 [Nostoc sp. C052]